MVFTVTYRAKDGALREERIEAANRAECVAECRRRGIAPTKIAEGRSGKSAASPKGSRTGGAGDSKRTTARWVAAVMLIAAVVGGGVWWWSGRVVEKPTGSQQRVVKKAKTEKPPKAVRTEVRPVAPTNAPAALPEETPVEPPKKEKYLGTVTTQRFSRVVTLADGTVTNIRHKAIFRNQMEQIISSALNPRGIAVPLRFALRRFTEEQIKEMFHTDLKAEPGDSELVLARKMELQDLKEQVRALEKKGHTYDEIFDEIDQIGRNVRAEVRNARQGLSQLIKAGESEEVIGIWMEQQNKKLKELGEPPLRIPANFLLKKETENTERK